MKFKDIIIVKTLKAQNVAQDFGKTTVATTTKQIGEVPKYKLLKGDDTPVLTQFYLYKRKQTPHIAQMIETTKQQSELQKKLADDPDDPNDFARPKIITSRKKEKAKYIHLHSGLKQQLQRLQISLRQIDAGNTSKKNS